MPNRSTALLSELSPVLLAKGKEELFEVHE
jgi:hypothetical protein